MADGRRLEKTKAPGVYRRHGYRCNKRKKCGCPYIVRWKAQGQSHKQMFDSYDLAREFKGGLDSGKTSRRPLSSETVAGYYEAWLANYGGRTARGLEETTRREYEISFRLHVLKHGIARLRMRDLGAPDVRDWLRELEKRGCSPTTIRKAKAALSVMLACAVEDGDLGSNPAAGVRYVPSELAQRRHPKRKRRPLTATDITSILNAMPEEWRAFFTLLAQTGLRVGEALGLTWGNVHLGDDPHILVVEQVYAGKRKRLKTDASEAKVPLSSTMASWLTELRPEGVKADAPVFPSTSGTPLNYHNVYSRVLRPALERSRIATVIGHNTVRRRGKDIEVPIYDYHGVAFHAFRKAAGSLLLANGKTLKQVQGWLRHSQLTTTMNVYITQVDDGLGSADVWDEILPGGPTGAPTDPSLTSGGPNGGPSRGFVAPEGVADESETPKTTAVS